MLRLLVTLALALAIETAAWAKTPTEFEQHDAEATRLYKVGKFDESIVELQAAYRINPQPWLLINIGRCHLKANRPNEALDAYNQALKGKVDASEQKEILAGISSAIRKRDKQREDERLAAEQRTAATVQEKALLPPPPLPAVPEKKPLYKKAWFWGIIGGGVAAVGLAVVLGVTLRPTSTLPDDVIK